MSRGYSRFVGSLVIDLAWKIISPTAGPLAVSVNSFADENVTGKKDGEKGAKPGQARLTVPRYFVLAKNLRGTRATRDAG